MAVIETRELTKVYKSGRDELRALVRRVDEITAPLDSAQLQRS